ncbi:Pectate lyase E like protein [Verticillium longisporum]|uniref:Probable pectate lyase F n=1 Tax=Verticillium longisporum TaxID=100787 RepID=A0A8I2Z4X2_VERLO|nr:Pectate lyase E like protein [Verticillium longisporum]
MKTAVLFSISALSAYVVAAQAPLDAQCGGSGWTGETSCEAGSSCVAVDEWYSHCVRAVAVRQEEEQEQEEGGDAEEKKDKKKEEDAGQDSEQDSGRGSGDEETGGDAGNDGGDDASGEEAGGDTGNDNDSGNDTGNDSGNDTGDDSGNDDTPASTLQTVVTSAAPAASSNPDSGNNSGSGSDSGSADDTATPTDADSPSASASLSPGTPNLSGAPPSATSALPVNPGGSGTANGNIPAPAGTELASAPIKVSGALDGGMKLYDRDTVVCAGQAEGGDADAIYILDDGATLSNVIIGPNQGEGVHCLGTCTLENVWFQAVCEDAITLKQSAGTSRIVGGGAFDASDKIIQFNGFGTVEVTDFYAENYGKLVRSCGNCKGNGGARNIVIGGVKAVSGGALCGINTNLGDTCSVVDSCQSEGKSCELFEGNNDGGEPAKIGEGPDGSSCTVSGLTTC